MRKSKKRLTRREYRVLKALINEASKPAQDSSYSFAKTTVGSSLATSISSMRQNQNSRGDTVTTNQCTTMLPSVLYVCQLNVNTVHVLTYLSLSDVEYTFVQADRQQQQVAFLEEEHLNDFYAWYDQYKKKFPEDQLVSCDYPPPTDGHYPIMIAQYDSNVHSLSGSSDDIHERWVWCLENLTSEVRYLSYNFFFCNPEDAMLYKLKYTTT